MQQEPHTSARYGPNAILAAGMARPSASTPIAVKYDLLLLVMVLDRESGIVLDVECNMLVDISSEYIASLLVGRCFYTELEEMIAAVQRGYHRAEPKGAACLSQGCLFQDARAQSRAAAARKMNSFRLFPALSFDTR